MENENDIHEITAEEIENFEILKKINQGSFGEVYKVRDWKTNTIYAMKINKNANNNEKNVGVPRDVLKEITTVIDS